VPDKLIHLYSRKKKYKPKYKHPLPACAFLPVKQKASATLGLALLWWRSRKELRVAEKEMQ
jgi:hypothetical protein